MNEKLNRLLEMFWNEDDECYFEYYYDENDNNKKYNIETEIKKLFDESGLKYIIPQDEIYDRNIISVAWIDRNEKIYLKNILIGLY